MFEPAGRLPKLGVRPTGAGSLDVFRNRSHKECHPTHLKKQEGLAARAASAGPSQDVTSLSEPTVLGGVVFDPRREPEQVPPAEAAARFS